LGPLPLKIWVYNFRVQGVDVADPSNPAIKPVPPGFAMSSFVEVPGDTPAFYDSRPVPHGEIRMVLYDSKTMGVTRWVWIYTRPNYDKSGAKYPVLYLLHGNGEALSKPEVLNSRLRLLWVSCGKQDFLYQANRQFVDMLKSKGVNVLFRETEGSHVWSVWRHYLNETAPMLFAGLRGKK
jgi:enterochelin esterase-like enzyme